MIIVSQLTKFLFELLQSWLDGLKIFLPKNLKLFLLATLNAVRYAFIPTALWIILIFTLQVFILLRLTYLIPIVIMGFVWLIRPSVEKKGFRYLSSSLRYFIFGWLILVAFSEIYFWPFNMRPLSIEKSVSLMLFSMIGIIFLLFLFDRKPSIVNSLQAIKRAVLFIFYNLPFMVTIITVFYLLSIVNAFLLNNFGWLLHAYAFRFAVIANLIHLLFSLLFFIFSLFFACLLSIFYTKRVHEQYSIYFA